MADPVEPGAPPSIVPPATGRAVVPKDGEWPCQFDPTSDTAPDLPPRLVAFLYRLLRDGAAAPGDIENHAIQATGAEDGHVTYTNAHIEAYARSLAGFLVDVP